jgi:uncharacterized protein (TIGR02453 family)
MKFFTKAFLDFFRDLSANNATEWFQANKKRYESDVKQPFEAFVSEMIARIAKVEPESAIEPKDAIFRINKDTRFSKDKSPYKTFVSANISQYGRSNKAYPGFYFQLSHTGIEIFGGAYMPEKDELQRLRTLIAGDLPKFERIINGAAFKKHYGQLQGEAIKRMPEEWKSAFEKQPLVANKQFYFQGKLPASVIVEDKLPDRLFSYFEAAREVNGFLRKAFK